MRTNIFLTDETPTVERYGLANYTIEMGDDLTLMVPGVTEAAQLMFLRRLRTACDVMIRRVEDTREGDALVGSALSLGEFMDAVRR